MKVTAGPLQISGVTFTGGTDGKDEAFTSCSPCNTITANGGGALFNQAATVDLDGSRLRRQLRPRRRRDRQRGHADADRRRVPQQRRGVRRRAVLALRDGHGHPCRFPRLGRHQRRRFLSARRDDDPRELDGHRQRCVQRDRRRDRQPGRLAHADQRHARRQPPRRAGDRSGRQHVGAEHDPRRGLHGRRQRCLRQGRSIHVRRYERPAGVHRAGDHHRPRQQHRRGHDLRRDRRIAGRSPARPGRRQRRLDGDRGAAARQPGDRRRQRQRLSDDRSARHRTQGRALRRRRLRGGQARARRPSRPDQRPRSRPTAPRSERPSTSPARPARCTSSGAPHPRA